MQITIKRRYRDNLHGSIDISETEDLNEDDEIVLPEGVDLSNLVEELEMTVPPLMPSNLVIKFSFRLGPPTSSQGIQILYE